MSGTSACSGGTQLSATGSVGHAIERPRSLQQFARVPDRFDERARRSRPLCTRTVPFGP